MTLPLSPVTAASGMAGGPFPPQVRPVRIAGVGGYAPARVMTNHDLEGMVETSDEWITTRTGIKERRIAAPDEASSDLAFKASRCALEQAGVEPRDLDLIIVPTATPDMIFPNTASLLQDRLGATRAGAFDLSSACTGFIYGAATATGLIASGMYGTVLVAASECMSRIVDWTDRNTCVLFGDGAGAVVLRAEDTADDGQNDRGILATRLHADGRHNDLLYVDGGASTTGTVGKLRMKGREVFRHAVTNLSAVLGETLQAAGHRVDEVDWVVPHQANARILDATARKLGLSPDKVIVTVDRHANTSAASVPLALDVAVQDGRIKKGDLVVLEAMGGGFTWAAAAIRF